MEHELTSARLRVGRDQVRLQEEQVRLQEEMERDLLAQARQQKQQLVTEFYQGIVAQINELVREVCERTLASVDEQQGVLRGPVSERLRDLIKKVERLNFIEDQQIEQQIARLRAVLPTPSKRDEAKRGIARIDTTRIRRIVEELKKEAEATIVEIGLSPRQRTRRQIDVSLDESALILDEARRPRMAAGLEFSSRGSELAAKRRARKSL